MKMKNKLLLLFLAFLFFFTIKSHAFTYSYSSPFDTNNTGIYGCNFGDFTYSYFVNNNLTDYDTFVAYYKQGQWGNTYGQVFTILYMNVDTHEVLYQKIFDSYYSKTTNLLYYVKDNSFKEINNSFYINGSNSSHGHCVYFLDFNSDNTINNIYYLDHCGGDGNDSYSNNNERIIFNNDGSIWACGLSNFYAYNLSSEQITYKKYSDGSVQYVCVNGIDELSNLNVSNYVILPSYYTICENNTPVTYSNSMLSLDYTDIHTAYCNSSSFGDSDTIPYYEDYSSSKIVFNIEQGFIQESTKDITLSVIDENLGGKQFLFNFQLPQHKDDSVYYAIMDSYNRLSYNSVSANFTIYELFTPLEYLGSFDKYLLYDEQNKYFVPMARY